MRLREALVGQLSPQELAALPGAYDLIGDIALISVAPTLAHREDLIAATLLALRPNIRVVAKRQRHGGAFRVSPLQVIAGEHRTETLHREHGLRLKLDLNRVYFSPRSAQERQRIGALVQPGESVLVCFSGIAPYPLAIAAGSRAADIVAIERNPVAHAYARDNCRLNRASTIQLLNDDVHAATTRFGRHRFHRLLLPLPGASLLYLPALLPLLTCGGYLHCYAFQSTRRPGQVARALEQLVQQAGRRIMGREERVAGHTAPHTHRLCIDAQLN